MDSETVIKGNMAIAVLEIVVRRILFWGLSGNAMAEPRSEGVFHVSETCWGEGKIRAV